jgi:hypothetical protein
MESKLSRRQALRQGAGFGALAVFGAAACGKEQPKVLMCTDTSGLPPADLQIRETVLAYVDVSATPGKTCSNCQQFLPGLPNACGTCKILKGPINPGGNCKSYLAKPA